MLKVLILSDFLSLRRFHLSGKRSWVIPPDGGLIYDLAMPFFDDFYAEKLRGSHGLAEADAVLDLRGASREEAEATVDAALARSRFPEARSLAVLIDPATPTSGETLFQPIGRRLLAAKREGTLEHLNALPARDGAGFYIRFAG